MAAQLSRQQGQQGVWPGVGGSGQAVRGNVTSGGLAEGGQGDQRPSRDTGDVQCDH